MDNFQKIILISAIVMLIISLILIGSALSSSFEQQWPPVTPDCPDYWVSDGSGSAARCINVKDLGVCPPKEGDKHLVKNFNVAPYNGDDSECAKYTWATKCKLAWDGITYGVVNPCQN
jgi:hypothetical protein